MNFPTYPIGTLVQIISAAEFDALPKNDAGCALFLDPLPNGNADYLRILIVIISAVAQWFLLPSCLNNLIPQLSPPLSPLMIY